MERVVTTVAQLPRLGMRYGSQMRRTLVSRLESLRTKPKPTNEPNYQQFIEQL
jgi:hypothetical protein